MFHKRFALALALALIAGPSWAQNITCPTRPPGDSSNACASTAFVATAAVNLLPLNNTWLGTQDFKGGVTFDGKPNVWNQNAHWTGPVGGVAGQGASIDLFTVPPANYTGISGYVQPWAFSPTTGALSGDVTRAANIMNFTTLVGPQWLETGLAVNSTLNTGHVYDWVTTSSYNAGDYVFGVGVNIYTTASNCVTANNEPSGTGTTIDGTCTWTFVALDIFYGKMGASFFTLVSGSKAPSAAWGIYDDFTILGTVPGGSNYGHFWAAEEIAVTNGGPDANPNTDGMYGLLIDGFVVNRGIAAISVSPQTTTTFAWHVGLVLHAWAGSDYGIWDQGNSPVSFYSSGAHTGSSILDASTSGAFLHSTGHYSYAFLDESTSTFGINLSGTYSNSQIIGTGWSVNPAGNGVLHAMQITAIPTSAGSGGLYVCVDTSGNTYKKSACP